MFNKLILIGIACVLPAKINAQAVKMGEICPAVNIENIKNYSSLNWNLDSAKNKLLILDFWSTNCGACIKSFPKMEKLQQRFGDNIQILTVTEDSQEKIDQFFDLHAKIKKPTLPSIAGDTLMKKLFPYNGLPQHVWIDRTKKVIAITAGYNTTEENIQAYLAKNKVGLSQKKSAFHQWNHPNIPTADSAYFRRVGYYSYIIPYIDTFSARVSQERLDGSAHFNHIYFCNMPAAQMYLEAFNEGGKYNLRAEDIVLKVKNTSRFKIPTDENQIDDWNQKNAFIYDIRVPLSSNIYQAMKEDLRRFFDVEARIEIIDTVCLVIKKIGDINGLLTKGAETKVIMPQNGRDGMYRFQNYPFQALINRLQVLARAGKCLLPIKDGTGLKGNVDFALPLNLMDEFDLTVFRSVLQSYGLTVEKKQYPSLFLVLRERRSE